MLDISIENVILPNKPWYKNGKTKMYFDSYGIQPPIEIREYLKSPIQYNSDQLQQTGQVFCGHLCLYVLKQLGSGIKFQNVLNIFFSIIKMPVDKFGPMSDAKIVMMVCHSLT